MEIGTEISQKIRAAIKAKLVDLGAYVDDELPDYIMVMVANKKNLQQMTEDLSLFLADNSQKFCTWLTGLLDKLQTLTADPDQSTLQMSNDGAVVTATKTEASTETPPAVEIDITEKTDEFSVEMEKSGKKISVTTANHASKTTSHSAEQPSTILFQTAPPVPKEIDTTDGNSNKTSPPIIERITVTKKIVPPKDKPASRVDWSPAMRVERSLAARLQPPPESQRDRLHVKQLDRRSAPSTRGSTVSRKRKAVGSMLGAVIHHSDDEEDEGYDPHFPSVGNVASVVKVTERKSSIPKSLQANTSLLLRAMKDAQKSIAAKTKQVATVSLPQEPVPKVKRLMSRSRRQEMIRKLAQTVQEEYDPDDNYQLSTAGEDVLNLMSSSEDSRQFVTSPTRTSDLESDYEPELQCLSEEDEGTGQGEGLGEDPVQQPRRIIKDSKPKQKDKPLLSPRFIVTLDGIDPKTMGSVSSHEETMASDGGDLSSAGSDVEMEESDLVPIKKASRLKEKCKFYPNCKNGPICPYHHPTVPCKTFPKCKFGDKCLYIHPLCKFDKVCSKPNCPFDHTQKKPSSVHPTMIPNAYILTKPKFVSVMPVTSSSRPVASSSREINCRFYPNCTNMNCPYKHPMPCKFGFKCKNVGSCTFYHPPLPKASQLKWRKDSVTAL